MQEHIKNKTHEILQRRGLYLPASLWHQQIDCSIADGVEVWNRLRNDVLGTNLTNTYNDFIMNSYPRLPTYIIELPLLFTFGYSLSVTHLPTRQVD
jgi:hypothetical protein